MAKARYIGDPRHNGEGPAEVDSCRFHFIKNEWTEVSAAAAARLSVNNHFEVEDGAETAPVPPPSKFRKSRRSKAGA